MTYKRVGFIGLGLIGGSIAKIIKNKYPKTELLALASSDATIKSAYEDHLLINAVNPSFKELASCDLLFLCAPVRINADYLFKLKPYLTEHTLLTDVGSVKGDIYQEVCQLNLEGQFIGGHPMAGSEAIGYAHSSLSLLENAYYILTTNAKLPEETVSTFKEYIASLGSIPMLMTTEEHDFSTAAISHLPHVLSATLVNLVKELDENRGVMKAIAAGGFRDITRISSSSPVMWQHICLANKNEIIRLLDLYIQKLSAFKTAVSAADASLLLQNFTSAKDFRDSFPMKDTGMLPPNYECYCDLDDKIGGIATIATLLASQSISIKNIGIVHNREFQEGVLLIEFYNASSLKNAMQLLKENHYAIYSPK